MLILCGIVVGYRVNHVENPQSYGLTLGISYVYMWTTLIEWFLCEKGSLLVLENVLVPLVRKG